MNRVRPVGAGVRRGSRPRTAASPPLPSASPRWDPWIAHRSFDRRRRLAIADASKKSDPSQSRHPLTVRGGACYAAPGARIRATRSRRRCCSRSTASARWLSTNASAIALPSPSSRVSALPSDSSTSVPGPLPSFASLALDSERQASVQASRASAYSPFSACFPGRVEASDGVSRVRRHGPRVRRRVGGSTVRPTRGVHVGTRPRRPAGTAPPRLTCRPVGNPQRESR
jgi:hypothetical protein